MGQTLSSVLSCPSALAVLFCMHLSHACEPADLLLPFAEGLINAERSLHAAARPGQACTHGARSAWVLSGRCPKCLSRLVTMLQAAAQLPLKCQVQ